MKTDLLKCVKTSTFSYKNERLHELPFQHKELEKQTKSIEQLFSDIEQQVVLDCKL